MVVMVATNHNIQYLAGSSGGGAVIPGVMIRVSSIIVFTVSRSANRRSGGV